MWLMYKCQKEMVFLEASKPWIQICQTDFYRICPWSAMAYGNTVHTPSIHFNGTYIWASSRENLSSGFATRVVSNRPAQPHRLARVLAIASRGIILSKQRKQRRWSDCTDVQADLRLCCSHMAQTGFLMTWLICSYWAWAHWMKRTRKLQY